MCRKTADGGRRCPSHSNAAKIAARNTQRREDYQAGKKTVSRIQELAESGIPAIAGKNFETSYFNSTRGAYDPELFVPVRNADNSWRDELDEEAKQLMNNSMIHSKPEDGGMWSAPASSTTENGIRTAWTDWASDQGFSRVQEEVYEIKANKHAVIIACDSVDDLKAVSEKYPGWPVNWEAMAEDGISGLHLTEKGVQEAKGCFDHKVGGFGMWDIPSTLWFSKDAFTIGKSVKTDTTYTNHHEDRYDIYDSEEGDGEYALDLNDMSWMYE